MADSEPEYPPTNQNSPSRTTEEVAKLFGVGKAEPVIEYLSGKLILCLSLPEFA